MICGLHQEISAWKLFLWKVQVLGYICHIYHLCSKWILMELRAFEATCKIIVFNQNHLWKCYLQVYRINSRFLNFYSIDFIFFFSYIHPTFFQHQTIRNAFWSIVIFVMSMYTMWSFLLCTQYNSTKPIRAR